MSHHWQNTGKQKGRIQDARINSIDADSRILNEDEKICHKCPEGCKEEETELHYLDCQSENAKKRVEAILTVK